VRVDCVTIPDVCINLTVAGRARASQRAFSLLSKHGGTDRAKRCPERNRCRQALHSPFVTVSVLGCALCVRLEIDPSSVHDPHHPVKGRRVQAVRPTLEMLQEAPTNRRCFTRSRETTGLRKWGTRSDLTCLFVLARTQGSPSPRSSSRLPPRAWTPSFCATR